MKLVILLNHALLLQVILSGIRTINRVIILNRYADRRHSNYVLLEVHTFTFIPPYTRYEYQET